MIERDIEIINRLGLHARAAAKLVDCAGHFASRIRLGRIEGPETPPLVDAKSIMSVMMLAAGKGSILKITAEGADEEAALTAIIELITDRFGEPD